MRFHLITDICRIHKSFTEVLMNVLEHQHWEQLYKREQKHLWEDSPTSLPFVPGSSPTLSFYNSTPPSVFIPYIVHPPSISSNVPSSSTSPSNCQLINKTLWAETSVIRVREHRSVTPHGQIGFKTYSVRSFSCHTCPSSTACVKNTT